MAARVLPEGHPIRKNCDDTLAEIKKEIEVIPNFVCQTDYRRLPDEMKATVANYDINRMNGHSYLLRGGRRMDTGVPFVRVCGL
jgi:hypothetical protein